ncbi:MAG: hypothetical protein WCE44_14710 [Candidatus Velthaea sp.]
MAAPHVERRILDLAIAQAIREHAYPIPEEPVCAFSIGAAGERCRRCGASYEAHYKGRGKVAVALHRVAQPKLDDAGADT